MTEEFAAGGVLGLPLTAVVTTARLLLRLDPNPSLPNRLLIDSMNGRQG